MMSLNDLISRVHDARQMLSSTKTEVVTLKSTNKSTTKDKKDKKDKKVWLLCQLLSMLKAVCSQNLE